MKTVNDVKEGMQYICYKECYKLDLTNIDLIQTGSKEELFSKIENHMIPVYTLDMITPPVNICRMYGTPRIVFDDPEFTFPYTTFNIEHFLEYFKPYDLETRKELMEKSKQGLLIC